MKKLFLAIMAMGVMSVASANTVCQSNKQCCKQSGKSCACGKKACCKDQKQCADGKTACCKDQKQCACGMKA